MRRDVQAAKCTVIIGEPATSTSTAAAVVEVVEIEAGVKLAVADIRFSWL
ncbi:MAG: hypothetical protein WDN46_23330 [Methylocella sp.]